MSSSPVNKMRLYSAQSERLYLNATEVDRFLHAANNAPEMVRLFALTLAYTGMRLSEACCLRRDSIQADARVLSVLSLKKRQKRTVREIPMPAELAGAYQALDLEKSGWIWGDRFSPVPRITAYRWIKHLMAQAKIDGPKACPKGLRHAFGARATMAGVPLHMLQRWMGHASMETTAIYATVLGPDQLRLSDQMWEATEKPKNN